jgi:hypothetical protein
MSHLDTSKQKKYERWKVEPGIKIAVGLSLPTGFKVALSADGSCLSGKDFAWHFLKLTKIIQLVKEAEKTGSLIYSSSLETVPHFLVVRVGGNFSTCIIAEDISGHDYARSLRQKCFQSQRQK